MAKRGRKPGSVGKCSVCGRSGHTKRTCPNKSVAPVGGAEERGAPNQEKESFAPPTPEQVAAVLEKASEFSLNRVVARLLFNEPFFAAISRHIDKSPSYAIPTAGVRFNTQTLQFELLYNPVFMCQLTSLEQTDVLKHEYYHIVLDHLTGRMPPDCRTNPKTAKRWNFATDLAINSHLDHLPAGCLKPGVEPCKDVKDKESAEYYYHNMPKELQQQLDQMGEGQGQGQGSPGEDSGSGGVPKDGQMDDHSGWCGKDAVDEQAREFAKERMREIARKAVEESSASSAWGTVSETMRGEIMRLLYSTVDWKKVLRYFIKTSQKADKSSSIRRINKRFPYIHAGRKTNRTAKLAIAIDESGSVGDKLLAKFFAELNKLADLATFTVIPFDHEIAEANIYTWRKGTHKLPKRVRCGGTDFDAPTNYVNKNAFDGMIVLTDMCAPKPGRCKVQRLWMTNEESAKNPYFKPNANERIVAVKAENDW